MTQQHTFLLEPGNWLGTGTITFSGSDQTLKFYSRWAIACGSGPTAQCTQTVEIEGGGDHVINRLNFNDFKQGQFTVILENQLIGHVEGKGVVDEAILAWEYRDPVQDFEGFEVYERKGENDYEMRAEYASLDNARTYIKCKLWKESSEKSN